MAKDKKLDALRSVGLFAACSTNELKTVARVTDRVEVPAGGTLMQEGAVGRELWIIVDGTADISQKGRTIRTVGPGEAIGELALLDGNERSATVTAASPLTAYVVGARSFTGMLRDVPSIALKIMETMASRLREAEAGKSKPLR